MKFKNVETGKRLALGFGLVLLFTFSLGIVSVSIINQLSALTVDLYEHPFTVSNAVKDIKAEVLAMDLAMQDVARAGNDLELFAAVDRVKRLERSEEQHFKIVFDRYLGNPEDVKQAYQLFVDWKPIREGIIQLRQQSDKKDVLEIDRTKAKEHILKLEERIQVITDFAKDKADSFIANALAAQRKALLVISAIITLSLLLGALVSVLTTKGITGPLRKMVRSLAVIATGDLDEAEIPADRADEIGEVARSLQQLVTTLRQTTEQAKVIASGNYLADIQPRSAKDGLAIAMQVMTRSLREISAANERSNWLKNGQAKLDDQLRGELSVLEVAERIARFVSEYLNARIGALYVNADDDFYKLVATYAYRYSDDIRVRFGRGEGLVGQAALEKKSFIISQVPEDYIKISSGLGERLPVNLLVSPFIHNDSVTAVLELGSLQEFSDLQLTFIEEVSERLAIALNSAQSREKLKEMLRITRNQAEKLERQQEELRAANEELQAQTEELTNSQEELQAQQEELRAINEELEEKSESLERQKAEIESHNQELAEARFSIEKKAADLAVASKYKSEFLANMSHELRTPLNSLLLLARNLAENKAGKLDPDQVESAKIIQSCGHELLDLINEVLDLSKIEAGRMTLDVQEVSVQKIVDHLRANFQPLARDKGLNLAIDVAPNAPATIVTDYQRLGQILKNLLSNALKFTAQGGVTVSIAAPAVTQKFESSLDAGQFFSIAVADTGIGIGQENQKTIFHAFQQADGGTSRKYGGTGLGLSISTELAKLLGGEIQLQSEPGKGSTFTILLPVRLPDKKSETPTDLPPENRRRPPQETLPRPGIASSAAAKPARCPVDDDRHQLSPGDKAILIIEDDVNFAKVLCRECHAKKLKCIFAPSGEEGLELADRYAPVAIILDINLPGMSGWDVLDHLKMSSNLRHIPVHMMSVEEATIDALKKGAIAFLTKPVGEEELQRCFFRIEQIINREISNLLVVEDNDILRREILKIIGNGDVKSSEAVSGQEAMEAMRATHFDCVVLDLGLPDMSGFELLDQLEAGGFEIPPIVIYTGRELSREENEKLRHYTESIIIKGVKSEERLLDETALFLHRVVEKLPEQKRKMIASLHDQDQMFAGKRILLVDDDMRNTFALAKVLNDKKFEVTIASDGQQALDLLAGETRIDLVLMDIMMPVMDGYETMRKIREIDRFWDLPIIALTAKAMREDREKCMQAGASDYLSKPVEVEKLLSMMRVWLYR